MIRRGTMFPVNDGSVFVVTKYVNHLEVSGHFIGCYHTRTTSSQILRKGSLRMKQPRNLWEGEEFTNKNGLRYYVVKYTNSSSVTVKFLETGYVTKTWKKHVTTGM